MKKFYVYFDFRKIKNISCKKWFVLLILILSLFYLSFQIYSSSKLNLDELETKEIYIDDVVLVDTYNSKSSRMKLKITADNNNYFLWYPQRNFKEYKSLLEKDLLSLRVRKVKVITISSSSLINKIRNQIQIVDLRSENTVYYDIEIEKKRQSTDFILLIFMCLFLMFFCCIYVVAVFYFNRIIILRKKNTGD